MHRLAGGMAAALCLFSLTGHSQDASAALRDARQRVQALYSSTAGENVPPATQMMHGSLARVVDGLKRAEDAGDTIRRDPLDAAGTSILDTIYRAMYDAGSSLFLTRPEDKTGWRSACAAIVKMLVATPYVNNHELHLPECPDAAADVAKAQEAYRVWMAGMRAKTQAEQARNPTPPPPTVPCQPGDGAFPHDCHSQVAVLRNAGPFFLAITRNATHINTMQGQGSYRHRDREVPSESESNRWLYDRLAAAGIPLRPATGGPSAADYPSIEIEILIDDTPGVTLPCGLATRQAPGAFSYLIGLSVNELLELPGRQGTKYPVTTWRRFETGSASQSERQDLNPLINVLVDSFAKEYTSQNAVR